MPGAVIYKGPSRLDDAPIVVIAVWQSKNSKTGDMVQTYIMREDIDPREANKYGEDASICGDCPHKGVPTMDPDKVLATERTCYVTLGQGPLIVFNAYKRGSYPDYSGPGPHSRLKVRDIGTGRKVRIGTYGDGAAAPVHVWYDLLYWAEGMTAYTHQWRTVGNHMYMASVDSIEEAQEAWEMGLRTFRIIHDESALTGAEILCPSYTRGVHCEDCLLCDGTKRAHSIAIPKHGSGKVYFSSTPR